MMPSKWRYGRIPFCIAFPCLKAFLSQDTQIFACLSVPTDFTEATWKHYIGKQHQAMRKHKWVNASAGVRPYAPWFKKHQWSQTVLKATSMLLNKIWWWFDIRTRSSTWPMSISLKSHNLQHRTVMCKIAWSVVIPEQCWGTIQKHVSWSVSKLIIKICSLNYLTF